MHDAVASEVPAGADGPGVAVVSRQGAPRLVTRSLLEQVGLGALPPVLSTLEALLTGAGWQPAGAGGLWERGGQVLRAGETPLEDGARLWWTQPEGPGDEARRDRARYLSLASHDLRGALANVRSYAGLLLGPRYPLEPRMQRGLQTIARNADRALAFAQDFFDAARADLGALAFEPDVQPVTPLLEDAVRRFQAEAQEAQVGLTFELEGELPELRVDAGRLQHAVEALVAHQLLRAQAGERIEVRPTVEPDAVRVRVRREGLPLSQEEAALVFRREERAFREKKLEDPLRVSLARQEARLHGGDAGVETDAEGTTLWLTLPR